MRYAVEGFTEINATVIEPLYWRVRVQIGRPSWCWVLGFYLRCIFSDGKYDPLFDNGMKLATTETERLNMLPMLVIVGIKIKSFRS